MFVRKNVCDFSNPANMKFLANGNYLRFFILFESLNGKRKNNAKVYFCDYTTSQRTHLKSRRKNLYFYSIPLVVTLLVLTHIVHNQYSITSHDMPFTIRLELHQLYTLTCLPMR